MATHHCETCRKYVDPASKPEPFTPLDLVPYCEAGTLWFLTNNAAKLCRQFEREPGDQ